MSKEYKFPTIEIKDTPTPCLYHEAKTNPSIKDPHNHVPLPQTRKKICDNVLDLIGNTPLVRLNKVPQSYGVKAEILVKLEMQNPGGSVKDRIALRMINDFIQKGKISGDFSKHTVLEPTSGNTGIGVAMVAAVKGLNCITAMPQKFSIEKEKTLTILGATCLRTPDGVPLYDQRSQFGAVFKYQCDYPETHHVCGQYINPSNPLAHYDWTAEEILRDTDGQFDYFFAGAGTGGTLTGCSRKFKDIGHPVKVVAVDPAGSYLMPGNENNLGPFMVEGIGQVNFRPRSIDVKSYDDWVKIPDKESFLIARRVIKEEGIMIGGSAGGAIWGAISYCLKNDIPAGKRCIVLCPDNIRSYISTFITDSWMVDFKYMDPQPNLITGHTLNQAIERMPHIRSRVSIPVGTTIKQVVEILNQSNHDAATIVDDQNNVKGGTYLKDIAFRLGTNRCKLTDPIESIMLLRVRKVSLNDGMDYIMHAVETNSFVIVQEDPKITINPRDVANFMVLAN